MTTPPEPIAYEQDILTSTTSAVQTAGGSDVTLSATQLSTFGASGYPSFARRIKACSAGTIGIKRINDSAFVPYPVAAGDYIDGRIIAVGGTSNGTSAGMTWIAEQ